MSWVFDDPKRFFQERLAFEELSKENWVRSISWRASENLEVNVDIDIEIHGEIYSMTMTYPEYFPETLPYIRPRDSTQRWSGHQFGEGGSLCLEWRADNWDSRVLGSELVKSAYTLLSKERHPTNPESVISAHELTHGQRLRGEIYRFVLTRNVIASLENCPNQSISRLISCVFFHQNCGVFFVTQVEGKDGLMKEIGGTPDGLLSSFLYSFKYDGVVLRHDSFNSLSSINSFEELTTKVESAGFSLENVLLPRTEDKKFKNQLLLLFGTDVKSLVAIKIGGDESPKTYSVIPIFPGNLVNRVPVESNKLASLRFGIVGLGSLGSKVAVSLARSGARKFLLMDDDIFLPENVCRNELLWPSVGLHKVQAVKEMLLLVDDGMEIKDICRRIGGQESALNAAGDISDLGKCDILIDATASANVFLHLSHIAKRKKIPLCWGECFAGGIGGLIARARPNIDPNPIAARSAILEFLSKQPSAPFKRATNYDTGLEEPLIAHDSEVTHISSSLTRLVIDTALHPDSSEFPYSAYLIGMKNTDGWIFSQPFDTQPITLQGEGWDKERSIDHEEQQIEALRQFVSMFEKKTE